MTPVASWSMVKAASAAHVGLERGERLRVGELRRTIQTGPTSMRSSLLGERQPAPHVA